MKIRLYLIFTLLIAFSIVLTGCGEKKDKESKSEHLNIGVTNLIDKVDPTSGGNPWSLTSYGVTETLYMQNENGKLVSHLVDKIKKLDDNTWEMTLKKDRKFSNGDPVNSKAVADCFNEIMSSNDLAKATAGKITFKPTGDLTLTLTTQRKTSVMESILCEWANVLYKHVGDKYYFTGPYVIKKLDPGVSIELTPNKYYDKKADKRPAITLKAFKDTTAMKQAFESGELDMAFTVTPDMAKELKKEGKIVKDIDAGYQYFAINNTKSGPMTDINLRRAVNLAIDRQAIIKVLDGGNVATGFFAKYYDFAGNLKLKTDLKEAKRILEKNGYTDKNNDKYIDKNGSDLTLRLVTYPSRPDLQIIMQQTASQLDKLGIKTTTKIVDNIDNYMKSGDYDIAFYAQHTAPTGEPSYALNMFFRSTENAKNVYYSNAKVDKLLDQMGSISPGEERNKLAKEIQTQIGEDLPVIYLIDPKWHIALSEKLKDYKPYCGDYYIVNPNLGL